jgi:hypothetical protein
MARMELSDDEEQKKLDARRRKLAEDYGKDEEGLEEQGLEDYVMPVKRALQGGMKSAVLRAVKEKVKPKYNKNKDPGIALSYDKPHGGNITKTLNKKEAEDKAAWLKKLLEK